MANRRKAPALQNESIIPPTLERAAQARAAGLDIEVAEPERTTRGGGRAFTDAEGRASRPWRVVDSLALMERAGTLTPEQRAAGERYRALYELSGRAGMTAAAIEPRSGGGDASAATQRRIEAGRSLERAWLLLGGDRAGPMYAVVRDVCGLGMTLDTWAEVMRCRRATVSDALRRGLDILASERW